MRSLARWCLKHRLAVVGIWLLVLVGAFFMQSLTGSTYASGTKLSGTPSAAAPTSCNERLRAKPAIPSGSPSRPSRGPSALRRWKPPSKQCSLESGAFPLWPML